MKRIVYIAAFLWAIVGSMNAQNSTRSVRPQTARSSATQNSATKSTAVNRTNTTNANPKANTPRTATQQPRATATQTPQTGGARARMQEEAQQQSGTQILSVRAQNMYARLDANKTQPYWSREIYRFLSDEKEENLPLFYPLETIDNRMNLFTLIFRLMAEGKLDAYEYLDGQEVFSDKYKLNFIDLLSKYQIMYEEEIDRTTRKSRYVIDDSNIPARDIKSYYVKEIYNFDQSTSEYGRSIECICPNLSREEDYGGGAQRFPLFWIRYADLEPYLNSMPIMTSNTNNTMRLTYNDFFRLSKYKGDIYKTTNLADKSITQIANNDSTKIRLEREKVEKQLKEFEQELWVKQDTTEIVDPKVTKKASTARAESKEKPAKPAKAPKVKSASGGSSSSGGASRSVRASVRR